MREVNIGPCERLVLLGGGKLLVDVAKAAKNIGYLVEVITSPRHHADIVSDSITLSDALSELSIKTLVVKDIKLDEAVELIRTDKEKTFFLSLGAAWIFTEDFINLEFNGLLFNLHGTRLPQNRGGGGFSWQIMTGNRFGFCILHMIDGGVDTGSIVQFDEFLYQSSCRVPSDYINQYREENFSFVIGVLKNVHDKQYHFSLTKQVEYLSSYWPRLSQDFGSWIDWTCTPEKIDQFICAFDDPYNGAKTTMGSKVVRVKKSHVNYQDGVFHPYQKGIVYRKGPAWLCIALSGGALVIEELLDDKSGESILADVSVGDRFVTSIECLADNNKRVVYTPTGIK